MSQPASEARQSGFYELPYRRELPTCLNQATMTSPYVINPRPRLIPQMDYRLEVRSRLPKERVQHKGASII
jgi:hypothetical protein